MKRVKSFNEVWYRSSSVLYTQHTHTPWTRRFALYMHTSCIGHAHLMHIIWTEEIGQGAACAIYKTMITYIRLKWQLKFSCNQRLLICNFNMNPKLPWHRKDCWCVICYESKITMTWGQSCGLGDSNKSFTSLLVTTKLLAMLAFPMYYIFFLWWDTPVLGSSGQYLTCQRLD